MRVLLVISTNRQLDESLRYLTNFIVASSSFTLDVVVVGIHIDPKYIGLLKVKFPSSRFLFLFHQKSVVKGWDILYCVLRFLSWRIGPYTLILFGNYNSLKHRLVLNYCNADANKVLLTDGAIVINVEYWRRHKIDNVMRTGVGRLLRIKPVDRLTFFTNYNLNPVYFDGVIEYESTLRSCSEKTDEIHFIGSYLIELNILKREELYMILLSLSKKYKQRIKYYLHPRERMESVRFIEEVCDVVPYERNYEEVFLNVRTPKMVISFYSSSLFELFNSDPTVEFLFIDLRQVMKSNSVKRLYEEISLVYKYAEEIAINRKNVRVVNFHDF